MVPLKPCVPSPLKTVACSGVLGICMLFLHDVMYDSEHHLTVPTAEFPPSVHPVRVYARMSFSLDSGATWVSGPRFVHLLEWVLNSSTDLPQEAGENKSVSAAC